MGVALGVMALITVLSVMNGFEKELRERILGMAAHATISEWGKPFKDWQQRIPIVENHASVTGVAPYIRAQGMLTNKQRVQGALIRGILPEYEPNVSVVAERMVEGDIRSLTPGKFNILLGKNLAETLGIIVGDKLTVVAPQPSVTPAGIIPRLRRFTVTGIFEIGMRDFDSSLALVHMDDAARLFRIDGISGLRVMTDDMFAAPQIARELASQLPGHYGVVDWTQYHKNFFRALKTEKMVMFVILALIVAVAAFNIVSTLIMVVTDKQSDIAILRTLGLSPGSIMTIFMVQGLMIGVVGTAMGLLGGVWLSLEVPTLVPALEQFLGMDFLSKEIYYISELPSDLRLDDVLVIGNVAFVMCLLSTIYPAWRASRTQPAEALRYE